MKKSILLDIIKLFTNMKQAHIEDILTDTNTRKVS